MCIALPARILAVEDGDAIVDLDGRRRRASLLRSPKVEVGDWALVAAGAVLRRLEPDEAAEIAELLRPVLPALARTNAPPPAQNHSVAPGDPR